VRVVPERLVEGRQLADRAVDEIGLLGRLARIEIGFD